MVKTIVMVLGLSVLIAASAIAAQPLTDKQMDKVTAGSASASAFAFGNFVSTFTFVSFGNGMSVSQSSSSSSSN